MLRGLPETAKRAGRCRARIWIPSRFASSAYERPAMTKYKLEYIWLDGYTPVPNLRGKTQIKEFASFPTLDQLPLWGFDGSSTMQAEGHNSDCVLKPVAVFPDGARTDAVLPMSEVIIPHAQT